jgi:hypothetical protein
MSGVDHYQRSIYREAIDVAVQYFGLPPRFTLPDLVLAMETTYRRSIELIPWPAMPLPFTGTLLATTNAYRIVYRTDLTVAQTQLIICHEVVHILRGHRGVSLDELREWLRAQHVLQTAHAADADVGDSSAVRLCGRTFSSHPDEFEAEYSGTYLASKLLPADRFLQKVLRL